MLHLLINASQFMTPYIVLLLFALWNLKSVKEKLQTFDNLKNDKSFLDEIKSIFHSF